MRKRVNEERSLRDQRRRLHRGAAEAELGEHARDGRGCDGRVEEPRPTWRLPVLRHCVDVLNGTKRVGRDLTRVYAGSGASTDQAERERVAPSVDGSRLV